MNNGEKFKTAKERKAAWEEYCKKHYSADKKCSECPIWKSGAKECRFFWLDLEYNKELKPKSCPFCGMKASVMADGDRSYVMCECCGVHQESRFDADAAIAAWNRRAKMTLETNETMNNPIFYQVMTISGMRCVPSYPYIGKDKEIAIAIATAHIAKGDTTTINEIKASELRDRLDRETTKQEVLK